MYSPPRARGVYLFIIPRVQAWIPDVIDQYNEHIREQNSKTRLEKVELLFLYVHGLINVPKHWKCNHFNNMLGFKMELDLL